MQNNRRNEVSSPSRYVRPIWFLKIRTCTGYYLMVAVRIKCAETIMVRVKHAGYLLLSQPARGKSAHIEDLVYYRLVWCAHTNEQLQKLQ